MIFNELSPAQTPTYVPVVELITRESLAIMSNSFRRNDGFPAGVSSKNEQQSASKLEPVPIVN